MNREVGRFLLETWQLFYWSFFCPSLLQQRMNEWSPQKIKKDRWLPQKKEGLHKDTDGNEILLLDANNRFVLQYLFISISISSPMVAVFAFSGQGWNGLIFLISPLVCYGIGYWLLPSGIGFCSPLLLAITYWQKPEFFIKLIPLVSRFLLPLPLLFAGVSIGSLSLFITLLINQRLLRLNFIRFARYVLWIGSESSVLLGCWVAGQNLLATLILSVLTSIWIFYLPNEASNKKNNDDIESNIFPATFLIGIVMFFITSGMVVGLLGTIKFGFAGTVVFVLMFAMIFVLAAFLIARIASNGIAGSSEIIAGVAAGGLAGSMAIILAGSVASIAIIPLPHFLILCTVISISCAPQSQKWIGVWIASFFVILGWENLEFNALWAIPVSVIGYYRILPDYFVSYVSSSFFTQFIRKQFVVNPASLLTKLPPYTSELLWLPLPNHAQILSDTFRDDVKLGLATFQKMQSISLPGFKSTIEKALPSIVADRFAAVGNITDLTNSETIINPLWPFFTPIIYQFDEEHYRLFEYLKSGNTEIDLLFPMLQQTAKATTAALQAGSAALRERGLERLIDKLQMLPAQLPGLGLKPQAVKRWQPAIERWKEILELEVAEQQKTSQGELLNPFQFGNPLRPDRAAIFKGRQDFADRLVRLILDRNRPTLVLHGPRRAGKTSFLLNLPRLLPSDLVPIYLDMQQGSMTASEGDFCYGLVRAIDRDTRSQGLQLPPIPSREAFYARPYPTLEDWLDLALPKLDERRLLLNLDEFEKIGSAIKDGRISDRLFDQLRSMIQHYDRLGFLFSGVQTLEELGPRWSNYFISVVPMEMHYLEPHEAEDLLLHPDPEFTLRYDAGIVAEILRLTRCQPYLLQLIGSAIVNQANLQHTQLATTTLLQAAIQDAFTNGEPYFTNIWTEFTGNNDNPAEVTAGQQILIALAQGNTLVETSDETTAAARRRLLRYHVIERNGDIDKIEIPLFEQWVRERAIET
jgi:hypothetical protein